MLLSLVSKLKIPNSVVPTGRSWLSAADLVSAHFDVICDFFVDPLDIAVNGRAG